MFLSRRDAHVYNLHTNTGRSYYFILFHFYRPTTLFSSTVLNVFFLIFMNTSNTCRIYMSVYIYIKPILIYLSFMYWALKKHSNFYFQKQLIFFSIEIPIISSDISPHKSLILTNIILLLFLQWSVYVYLSDFQLAFLPFFLYHPHSLHFKWAIINQNFAYCCWLTYKYSL